MQTEIDLHIVSASQTAAAAHNAAQKHCLDPHVTASVNRNTAASLMHNTDAEVFSALVALYTNV